jgi:hypothetical protein
MIDSTLRLKLSMTDFREREKKEKHCNTHASGSQPEFINLHWPNKISIYLISPPFKH